MESCGFKALLIFSLFILIIRTSSAEDPSVKYAFFILIDLNCNKYCSKLRFLVSH